MPGFRRFLLWVSYLKRRIFFGAYDSFDLRCVDLPRTAQKKDSLLSWIIFPGHTMYGLHFQKDDYLPFPFMSWSHLGLTYYFVVLFRNDEAVFFWSCVPSQGQNFAISIATGFSEHPLRILAMYEASFKVYFCLGRQTSKGLIRLGRQSSKGAARCKLTCHLHTLASLFACTPESYKDPEECISQSSVIASILNPCPFRDMNIYQI